VGKSPGVTGSPVALVAPNVTLYDMANAKVTKTAGWTVVNDLDAVGASYYQSKTLNDTLTFTFKGASLFIRFKTGPDCGNVSVKVDSTTNTYDLYNALSLYKYLNVAVGLNFRSNHTVSIKVLATKNAGSTDYYVRSDAYLIRKTDDALSLHSLEYIGLIDTINTINTIGLISSITNIANVASVDLIDRITLIDTISKITDVALIDKITDIALIDKISDVVLIDEVKKIDDIVLIDKITDVALIDKISDITLIDSITQISKINPISAFTIVDSKSYPSMPYEAFVCRQGDFIYMAAGGYVGCIDAATLSLVAISGTGHSDASCIYADTGHVYVGSLTTSNYVTEFALETVVKGRDLNVTASGSITSVVSNGTYLFAAVNGKVYKIDLSTFLSVGNLTPSKGVSSLLAIGPTYVYAVGGTTGLVAINPTTFAEAYTATSAGVITGLIMDTSVDSSLYVAMRNSITSARQIEKYTSILGLTATCDLNPYGMDEDITALAMGYADVTPILFCAMTPVAGHNNLVTEVNLNSFAYAAQLDTYTSAKSTLPVSLAYWGNYVYFMYSDTTLAPTVLPYLFKINLLDQNVNISMIDSIGTIGKIGNLPASLSSLGNLKVALQEALSGTDIGDVTINNAAGASAVNIQDGGNSITIDGSVTVTGSVTANAGTSLNTSALALESGGNLAAILAKLDVALSTRALEAGGHLAAIDGHITTCNTGAIAGSVTANAGTNLNTSALALEAGHLAAIDSHITVCNTGAVTISAALPTGTNSIGYLSQSTKHDSASYLTKVGTVANTGDNSIVNALATKLIKVHKYSLQGQGTVTATFYSDTGGSAAAIGQPWQFQAREGVASPFIPYPAYHFATAAGKALNIYLSTNVTVAYEIVYSETDTS